MSTMTVLYNNCRGIGTTVQVPVVVVDVDDLCHPYDLPRNQSTWRMDVGVASHYFRVTSSDDGVPVPDMWI